MCDMLVDVMQELMMLRHGQLPLTNCNRSIFVGLGWPPTDVDRLPCAMVRTPIFNEHGRGGRKAGDQWRSSPW
jgi:hypothetical protein